MERLAPALEPLPNGAVPFFDRQRRPIRRLVLVTIIAGVRRLKRFREIWPWNAEGVIVPLVDDHIGSGGHVAGDAIGGFRSARMAGVLLRREARGLMTLPAYFGSGDFQFARMRIMAVAANDALRIHQALFEQMIVEDFVLHLAVVFEQVFGQERWQMRIQQRLARTPSLVDLAASRVAMRAKLNFIRGRTWRAVRRAAGFRIG